MSCLFISFRASHFQTGAHIPRAEQMCHSIEEDTKSNSRTDLWQETVFRNNQVKLSFNKRNYT